MSSSSSRLIYFLSPVQYEREWSRLPSARQQSTYTAARSESPSIYSRRFGDSPRSSYDDDPSISSIRPLSDTTQRNEDPYGSEDEIEVPVDESPDTRLSVMGPTTRVYSRAPWEVTGDNVLREEDEDHTETRSILSGRGRSKKPKDKDSSSRAKGRGFASSLARHRSSSVPRPSTDTQGLSSSTSSNYSRPSFSSNLRPESLFTSASQSEHPRSASIANGYHRRDRSPAPSPRSVQNGRFSTDPEMRPSANANPQTPIYQPHTQHAQIEGEFTALSPSPSGPSGGFPSSPNYQQGYYTTHGAASPAHYLLPPSGAVMPLASPHDVLPLKMAPWQHTPSSPTFHLVSLEEAQAMKAKLRSAAMGTPSSTSSSPYIRGQTVSGNTAQERLKSHTLPQEAGDFEDIAKSASPGLKARRSLLGLFSKKEKERSVTPRPASPPPPVPSLPTSIPNTPSGLAPSLGTFSAVPKSPRKIPPPSLDLVANSSLTANNAKDNPSSSPLPSANHQHATYSSSSPSSPPVVVTSQPRKKGSLTGLSTRTPLAKPPSINPNPGSGSPSVALPALEVRPVSTMFSSMPVDYLAGGGAASPPLAPTPPFRVAGDTPTTPGFSSRSASVSGSSDAGPQTPSVDHSANAAVLSQLRDQVNGAKEAWKTQIADLEAQVQALKKELEEFKAAPCAACGHVASAALLNGEVKASVLNRPRAKTGAAGGRTLF